jgi:hypothetical protein
MNPQAATHCSFGGQGEARNATASDRSGECGERGTRRSAGGHRARRPHGRGQIEAVVRVRETYGVKMADDQNPALLIAVTVAIDEITLSD